MYKYPYGDSQQLNLDWILTKLKELEEGGAGGGASLETVSNALISLTYNSSTQYRRYDYAFLNGKLYRCLSDTTGSFDPAAWQEALIGDDLAVLTRWINAIDAAAVVDVKFDTSGTNGKIQQKYHDQYHDVVEVDYTPVQNSKRPLSSNAGYELNGAIKYLNKQPKSYNVAHIGSFDLAGLQGCFNIGNTVYVYDVTNKKIIPVNLETGAIGTQISVDFWHGNDFVAIGNTVYCAPYSDNSNNASKVILKYTLGGTVTQLNPFSGIAQNCLYGIDKIDDDTLICALRNFGTDTINSTVFYKYVISSGAITQISVDWNGAWLGQSSFPHPMVFANGCLYLTSSVENGYYTLELTENTLKCVGYRSLPYSDAFGQALNELEGICTIPLYGSKFLVITSKSSFNSCLFCAVNVDGNTPNSMIKGTAISNAGYNIIHVSESNTTIWELGDSNYPFKSIERAVEYGNALIQYGIQFTIQLDSDIAEGDNSTITVFSTNMGLDMHGHTINRPITFNRGTYVVTGHIFAKLLTIRTGSKFNLITSTTLNDVYIDASELYEGRICTHNGTVTLSGGIWFAGCDPNENVIGSAVHQSLIKINRTAKPANLSIGGGTTLLLSGTK